MGFDTMADSVGDHDVGLDQFPDWIKEIVIAIFAQL
jgi:hypothetical protein